MSIDILMMFLCAVANGLYFVCGMLFTYQISWIKQGHPEVSVAMGYSCFIFLDLGLVIANQLAEPLVHVIGPFNLLRINGVMAVIFNYLFIYYNSLYMLYAGYFISGLCHQTMTFSLIYILSRNHKDNLISATGYVFSGSAVTFLITALATMYIVNPKNLRETESSVVDGGDTEFYFNKEVTQGFLVYCYLYAAFNFVISFLASFVITLKPKPDPVKAQAKLLGLLPEGTDPNDVNVVHQSLEVSKRSIYLSHNLAGFQHMNEVVSDQIKAKKTFRSVYWGFQPGYGDKPKPGTHMESGRPRSRSNDLNRDKTKVKFFDKIKDQEGQKSIFELKGKQDRESGQVGGYPEPELEQIMPQEKMSLMKVLFSRQFIIIFLISYFKTSTNFFYSGEMKIYGMMLINDDMFITKACLVGIVFAIIMRLSTGRLFKRLGFKGTYLVNIGFEMCSSMLYFFLGTHKLFFGIAVLLVRTSTGMLLCFYMYLCIYIIMYLLICLYVYLFKYTFGLLSFLLSLTQISFGPHFQNSLILQIIPRLVPISFI